MKFLSKKSKEKSDDESPNVIGDEGGTKEAQLPSEQAPRKLEVSAESFKFGIARRLEDAVNSRSDSKENRSPDLVPLSKDFDSFRKHLRQLHFSAKQYHDAMCKMNQHRSQISIDICAFAEGSAIEKSVCNTANKNSFLSIYQKSSAIDSSSYESEILAYISEWEAVTTRVDKDSLEVEKLRKSYVHYQNKVDSLRKKVNANESNGKETNEAISEKLKRNEEKLDHSSKEFEDAARSLCVLIEEVVHQGWKDVVPLITNLMKWESTRSKNEMLAFSNWNPSHIKDAAPSLICLPTAEK